MKTFATLLLASVALSAQAQPLKPEQIVSLRPNGFAIACNSPASLEKLIGHAVADEKTKLAAMLPWPCTQIPPAPRYKLLSVRTTMVEFTPADSGASEGVWTAIEAFQPAK